jgi:hypothetical protein
MLLADQSPQDFDMRHSRRPYDRYEDGPLYRQTPRRTNRRTVTMPERGVGPHVRLVFGEMSRQLRTYDDVEAASGVKRPTVKQWRRKNRPGLESLESVLNCLGWHFIAVPAHIEILPATVAAKVAEVAALAQMEMSEAWSAAVQIAALQLASTAEGKRILAEIDAERATRRAANDNVRQSTLRSGNKHPPLAETGVVAQSGRSTMGGPMRQLRRTV